MDAPAPSDATVRLAVFETFLREGSPPSVERLMGDLRRPREEIESALGRLDRARHLKLVPGTHRILMAFPFSAIATPYRVTVEGRRSYFANCAWDAIAFHSMLDRPVYIESYCHHCGDPLDFHVPAARAGNTAGTAPIVYLGVPAAEWWKDIITTCANTMVFFRTKEHLRTWQSSVSGARGAELTIETVLKLSEPLYARRLMADFERPSRDQLVQLFDGIGLTGEFWRI